LTPRQRSELLIVLPQYRVTWELVETQDEDVERHYWQSAQPYLRGDSTDIEYSAREFLKFGRAGAAAKLLAHNPASPNFIAETLEAILEMPPEPEVQHLSYELGELFKKLEAVELDDSRIARLEWAFLPVFERHGAPSPKVLHRELARNPGFFTEVFALIYRAENEEPGAISDEQRVRARRAHELLDSWTTVPGATEDGNVDAGVLKDWVHQARTELAANKRGAIGDQLVGRLLSHAPNGDDGVWPHQAVRDIIEEVRSAQLERGVEIGVHNNRGMISKGLMEGGLQERELAKRYKDFALALADRWPRVAAMLRRIEARYGLEAASEDASAELRKDGLWD
jgi:hypothetical protein